jgi:hypothetical protein
MESSNSAPIYEEREILRRLKSVFHDETHWIVITPDVPDVVLKLAIATVAAIHRGGSGGSVKFGLVDDFGRRAGCHVFALPKSRVSAETVLGLIPSGPAEADPGQDLIVVHSDDVGTETMYHAARAILSRQPTNANLN